MKRPISRKSVLLLMSFAVLASVAMPVRAQPPMWVDIPFAFLAGDQMFPPGEYTVGVDRFSRLVLQSRRDPRIFAGLLAHRADRQSARVDGGSILFHEYGGLLVLSGVWAPRQVVGYELFPSKRAKEAAKSYSGTKTASIALSPR